MLIGCSWFRCSQVNLLRVAKGKEGREKRERQKENTTRAVTSRRPSSQQPDLWASSHPSPPSVSCMQRRTRTGTEELRQRALEVGHLHKHCLQRTMKTFFLRQHTGERARERARWNNSYLLERSPKCKCDVSSLQLLCSDLQGRSQALVLLSSPRLKITLIVIFTQ